MEYAWMGLKNKTFNDGNYGKLSDSQIDDVCKAFDIPKTSIDTERHGVVQISRDPILYSIMIETKEAERVLKAFPDNFVGPYSNPAVAPIKEASSCSLILDDDVEEDGESPFIGLFCTAQKFPKPQLG